MNTAKRPWTRVTRARRCPICHRADWCLISPDGKAVLCPRTPSASGWKGRDGNGGYLHRLDGAAAAPLPGSPARPTRVKVSRPVLAGIVRQCQTALSPRRLELLSRSLGVSADSLRRERVGWAEGLEMTSARGKPVRVWAWTFPMVDAAGAVCGVRLRTEDGHKFSLTGGTEGLFVPDGLADGGGPLLVCEGPTSLAALLDLGYDAIGRPNCTGGGDLLLGYLRARPRRDLVVVGDHDARKSRPDGSGWFPGQEGAARLAQRLLPECRSVKVLVPPSHKDVRDWKNAAGATRAVVDCVIKAMKYVRRDP